MTKKTPVKKRIGLILAAVVALAVLAFTLTHIVGRVLDKRTYRLAYPALIEQSAEAYALDPYLVAAVIHVESGNRPAVVSSAGAVGLMQIMPTTGEWIAGKLRVEAYEEDSLCDPGMNITMGCWYLRFLLDRYDQDQNHALAAYNAGQGNVDKWLSDPAYSADGVLTNIPYEETDRYVEKVTRTYEKYKDLYTDTF